MNHDVDGVESWILTGIRIDVPPVAERRLKV